jgi:hypothetical protein
MSEPTAHNQGKPQAIARLRQKYPYQSVVMIGGERAIKMLAST